MLDFAGLALEVTLEPLRAPILKVFLWSLSLSSRTKQVFEVVSQKQVMGPTEAAMVSVKAYGRIRSGTNHLFGDSRRCSPRFPALHSHVFYGSHRSLRVSGS